MKIIFLKHIFLLILFFCFSCQNSTKEKVDAKPIKLLFGGDILLDRGVRMEIEKRELFALR